ncbi:hemolysin family protein [Desulfosarcina sp.]|uniref:hemolysin family protein n=1 Tax=Desulfosarcina sp. TaxID=2027861 RepID=UPI0029A22D80|nr:hemolysin family protein [Desulfosarcina sp.]MDX2452887.1 hemolysin family protein [Desulfosarcina sp.]MDX2490631.1 hemolysin family protein [Desulfosarcina sp.]
MMVNQFFLLFILLLLSGFFSSAETALFSISQTRARHMAKENIRSHQLIKRMKDDPHKLLTTILIGNNVVNVAASAIATSLTINMSANYAVGLSTGIMTFLILVFGEVIPKSFATRNNILLAKMTIYPIYWMSILFFPIIVFLNFIPRLTGRMSKTPSATEEELITFVEVVEEQGEIKEEEREMIHNVFDLDDTNASEIMTPRADMFVVDADAPLDFKAIAESGLTRIPVIEGDIDHVVGILNIKDIFMHQATSETPVKVRAIMRPPYFVPENKKLDRMLHQFKTRKNHMAIIVDEYGGVSGLITLEDALEELVGEIRDETDKEEPHIISKKPKEWVVLGKSEIEEVNEKTGMHIRESREYDTFSGFILDRIGRIPEEDEAFTIDGHKVVVMEMDGNRIKRYLVQTLSPKAES